MKGKSNDQNAGEFLGKIWLDAMATFDNSDSNASEHASSEGVYAVAAVDEEDERLDEEDDDAAALEEDDEENEEADVEDEAESNAS